MITRNSVVRISGAMALALLCSSGAMAQTMRFTTNVGSFDMVLNPGNDPNLQPIVDNIVAYIGLGRYHFSAVNRAAEGGAGTADDFVLQMGGFTGFPNTPDLWAQFHKPVDTFDPVIVDNDEDGDVDFTALSNTRGRVSLALQAGNPNSGTSSFFININNNSSLDSQGFVPFAEISNMATIDEIMSLTQRDLSSLAGQQGSLAYTDVPIASDGRMVVVTAISVISAPANFSFVGPISSVLQRQSTNPPASSAAADAASEAALDAVPPEAAPQVAVPEPSTVALGVAGGIGVLLVGRRRRATC